MAKFKKKKFRAEKSNSEDENKDLPEIEATEDEKKEIAKWTSNPDDAPETTDSPETTDAVSYTHLTLPTIYSV